MLTQCVLSQVDCVVQQLSGLSAHTVCLVTGRLCGTVAQGSECSHSVSCHRLTVWHSRLGVRVLTQCVISQVDCVAQ